MQSYLDLLRGVYNNGRPHSDRTGVGTRSVFGRQWRHDMRHGFPLLTTKRVSLRWVFGELRWFLSGSTHIADLQADGIDLWDNWGSAEKCAKFGRDPGDLGHVYGGLWRNFNNLYVEDCGDREVQFRKLNAQHPGNDQIRTLLADIAESPHSRRLMVNAWHASESRNVELPPCHYGFQVKCYDNGDMSMHVTMRSADVFLGVPFNIASYGLLLTMIAAVTGYRPLELVFSFGDLHLYDNHIQQAETQLDRYPFDLPSVALVDRPFDGGPLQQLLAFRAGNVQLSGYKHHPAIKAEVAV